MVCPIRLISVCNYSYQLYLLLYFNKKLKLTNICYLPMYKSLESHLIYFLEPF